MLHCWTLYGTLGCHLCDQAEVIIAALQQDFDISLDRVDIASSGALVSEFGMRIPVLKNNTTGEHIDWPFESEILTDWLIDPTDAGPKT